MILAGHVVARNEAGRYLERCLSWLQTMVDVVHVYDDASTDGTPEVAEALGCVVSRRSALSPGFAENEGAFRGAAWAAMEQQLRPVGDTWIVVVDADEFIVAREGRERRALEQECRNAEPAVDALVVHIHEVFGWDHDRGVPLVRVDGFWPTIKGVRLVRYRPDGYFAEEVLAGGSAPSYARRRANADVDVLHYGYLDEADRVDKYQRYAGRSGHSSKHVESILAPPKTRPWPWRVPH